MNSIRARKVEICKRVLTDVVIMGAGGTVLMLFRFLGNPMKRGFFCDDESLKHPFRDSTVTSAMLYGIGFVLGTVLISIVELIWIYCHKQHDPRQRLEINTYGKHMILVRDIYLSLVPFIFGAIIEHILTDIGKYSIGRLRPHFFDVCRVNFSNVDCSKGYILDFQCTGKDLDNIREVRLSFPSGHASFSIYVAVYLMIYLQRRLTFLFKSLIRPCLQMLIFVMAYYTCLSRVSDYKHHYTDVIAGAIIGVIVAVLVVRDVIAGAIIGVIVAVLVAYSVSDLFSLENSREVSREQYNMPKTENSSTNISTNL